VLEFLDKRTGKNKPIAVEADKMPWKIRFYLAGMPLTFGFHNYLFSNAQWGLGAKL
jgi:hypothetical protein